MNLKFIAKSVITLSLTFTLFSGMASAKAEDVQGSCTPLVTAKESEFLKSLNGNKVYEVENYQELAEKQGVLPPSKDAKLIGISMAYTSPTSNESIKPNNEVVPQLFGPLYLKNVRNGGNTCGANIIRTSYYQGPTPPSKMVISEKVASSFTSNTNVSASVVSAAVGFSVTSEFTVTDEYAFQVPAGKTYEVIARPTNNITNFEVWEKGTFWDSHEGDGQASRPIGICFYFYEH
ncbi:hypothetical protein [Paenibacillus chitinolyticus]|uniref:hypothetical protein n=1 Tax=Paenibacillus chitinolyticus TaxID=79263 RepID=UPI00366C88B1